MEELSGDLPMELVTEVLVRLPVKSLARFRCVCKSWNSLISSPDFASLHLSRYHKDDDNTFLLAGYIKDRKFKWMLLSSHTYEEISADDYAILDNENIVDRLDCRFPRGSSVNGLLLLSDCLIDRRAHRLPTKVMLWNPMIGKTHKLPTGCIDGGTMFGFGFSSSSNDYKVVAINAMRQKTSVHIYSLSTRTWRSIVEYEERIIGQMSSDGFVLVEGTLHFLSGAPNSHIVLFDVNDEVFRYIELPPSLACDNFAVVYRGMVGLLDFDYGELCWNLWVNGGEDLVPGSWHKMYTVRFEEFTIRRMLYSKENGEFLLSNAKGGMKLYNVESKEVKQIRESSSDMMVYFTLYKESLLLLN